MPVGSKECKNCSVGHFAGSTGRTTCLPCVGGVANVTGSKACTPCEAGQFIAERGRGYGCKTCAKGKGPTPNRTACKECNAQQVWQCGVCLDCKLPQIRLDNMTCVTPNTGCRPGTGPRNQSSSASEKSTGHSCEALARCVKCVPGSVSPNGGKCVACSDGNKVANPTQIACEPCGPGKQPSKDRSKCVDCMKTHFSSDGARCQLCRSDYVNNHRISCTPCAAGHGVTEDQSACVACPPGKFSSAGVCQRCLSGPAGQTIAASTGSVMCRNCPAGKVAHNNATECRCAAGTYNISAMVVRCFSAEYFPRDVTDIMPVDQSECQPCPACLDCSNIGSPVTKSGYRLRTSNDQVAVHVEVGLNSTTTIKPRQLSEHHGFLCPYVESCLSRSISITPNSSGACVLGHTGVLCQSCNKDWSKTPSGSCYECKEGSTDHLTILAVLTLVAFVVAYCGLSKYLARKRAKAELNASAGLLFDCLDCDRSGSISRDELRTGLAELGISLSPEKTFVLMESIDIDGNGDVDRDEFEACAS